MLSLLLSLLAASPALAGSVERVVGPSQVALYSEGEAWAIDDLMLIYDLDGTAIASLRINQGVNPHYQAEFLNWLAPKVIVPGLKASRFGTWGRNGEKGRTELLFKHEKPGQRVSAKYKRLLFTNIQNFTQSAAPLDKGEHVVNITSDYTYGITDRLSVGTIVVANFLHLYNIHGKYNLFDHRTMTVSAGLQHLRRVEEKNTNLNFHTTVFTAYMDSIANRDFISHLGVSLAYSRTGRVEDHEFGPLRVSSTIDASTEYILPNWDRLVVGPQYFIDTQTVGGFAQYVFIWDRYHLVLGVNSSNLLLLRRTSLAASMYWRF